MNPELLILRWIHQAEPILNFILAKGAVMFLRRKSVKDTVWVYRLTPSLRYQKLKATGVRKYRVEQRTDYEKLSWT
jgi:hypothetical protein